MRLEPHNPKLPSSLAALCDAEALFAKLCAFARPLVKPDAHDEEAWYLVGIASGGAWLAQRLSAELAIPYGIVSSTMHRDDFSQRGLSTSNPTQLQTHLNASIHEAKILLVDDVLFTGRTVRASLNEIYDYGRPARVQLAVLVDRGRRELPIAADFAAHTLAPEALSDGQRLALHRQNETASAPLFFSIEEQENTANPSPQ